MKFIPSFKSAKSLALAAATIATAIAGIVAPSQAEQPTQIVRINPPRRTWISSPASKFFTSEETPTMKFLPSIDSVRSICLIAATIATTRSETLFYRERGIF